MQPHQLRSIEHSNPWLRDPSAFPSRAVHRLPETWIPRRARWLEGWPRPRKAHLLVGARQVGKSSLLWRWLVEAGVAPLFLNAELPAIREWAASPAEVLEDLRGLLRPGMPVLIDEAQWLDEAGLLLKGLIDGGLESPLYVTGSSSYHLRSRTRESLAGRAARATLHPLSLEELAGHLRVTEPESPPLLHRRALHALALRQVVVGGYPEAWLAKAPEAVLVELLEAHVIRDASDLFEIKRLGAFRRMLLLLAGQTGQLVNLAEWAGLLGVSLDTVGAYVDLLEETHVAYRLRPFVGGRRAELTRQPKILLADPGLRSALTGCFLPFAERTDRGAAFECWVGAELRKRLSPLLPADTLHFWRSKSGAEVDFVIARPTRPVAVEAKAIALRQPKLSRSARSFIEAYEPSVFVIVNLTLDATERLGDTEIRWRPPAALADPALLEP